MLAGVQEGKMGNLAQRMKVAVRAGWVIGNRRCHSRGCGPDLGVRRLLHRDNGRERSCYAPGVA